MECTLRIGLIYFLLIMTGCASNTPQPPSFSTSSDIKHPRQLNFPSAETNPLLDNDVLRNALITWWQTPYRYGGTNLRGVDCSALMVHFYLTWGYRLPRTTAEQKKAGKRINIRNLLIGDLLFFRTSGWKISHVGMYAGEGMFVHASSSRGVTLSSFWHSYYQKRFVEARRMVW